MNAAKNFEDFKEIVIEMKNRRTNWKKEDKLGWYYRYRNENTGNKLVEN